MMKKIKLGQRTGGIPGKLGWVRKAIPELFLFRYPTGLWSLLSEMHFLPY